MHAAAGLAAGDLAGAGSIAGWVDPEEKCLQVLVAMAMEQTCGEALSTVRPSVHCSVSDSVHVDTAAPAGPAAEAVEKGQ